MRAPAVTILALLGALACGGMGGGGPDAREVAGDAHEVASPAPLADPAWITDGQGGVLILHGFNVNTGGKGAEGRIVPLEDADLTRLATHWRMNVARFLIFWDALEPAPGQIDAGYLERVAEQVDRLHAAGLAVMLDMHQDVYARRFCCDGAPEWAIRDDGLPFEMQAAWFANYLQPAVKRAFDNFWADDRDARADLQDHYAAAWAAVAARFRDHPGVIGFDLMDEPHPGSDLDPIELLCKDNPGVSSHVAFDQEDLGPFYQRVIDAIRAVDPDHWIFFEPRYGAPGLGMPSYLPVLTDPRPGAARVAYAPHLYSLTAEASGVYDLDQDRTVAKWEAERTKELERQPMPLLLGEFGFDHGVTNARTYLADVLAMIDRLRGGWAWWDYSSGSWGFHTPEGEDKPLTDLLVRPYPRRVAGVPLSWSWQPEERVFTLRWEDRAGVTGPTRVSLPAARHYPDGWVVTCDDPEGSWSWEWDGETEILALTTPASGGVHRLRITPAP